MVVMLIGVWVVLQMWDAGYFSPMLQRNSVKIHLTQEAIESGKAYTSKDFISETHCWDIQIIKLDYGVFRLNCECRIERGEPPHIILSYAIKKLEERKDIENAEEIYERVPLTPVIIFYIILALISVAFFPVTFFLYWLFWGRMMGMHPENPFSTKKATQPQ